MNHRFTETWCFADAHISRDHRVEHQVREVLADLALHVLGEAGAGVVHRQQHAGDRQARVEFALDVPALGPERRLHGVCDRVHAAQNRLPGILTVQNLLCHCSLLKTVISVQ